MIVIALAGRRIDAEGATPPRFPLDRRDEVEGRLRKLFEEKKAGALVCSGACGSDLIAMKVAGDLKMRRLMILPFDRATFRETSVVDRPGDWGPLYDEICDSLDASDSLVILGLESGDDTAYAATNDAILDQAGQLADTTHGEVIAVIVWEGQSRGDGDLTAQLADDAQKRGFGVERILTVDRPPAP